MVINRPLLGVIQTGEKTHPLMVCEQSDELGADATHQGIAKRYPDTTCCMTAFRKVNSTKAAVRMNNEQLNPTTNTTQDHGQGWKDARTPYKTVLDKRVTNLRPHHRARSQTVTVG
jgi:hypothetical protein